MSARAALRTAAGAALAALAVAVALVAEDARRWPGRLESGDVRFVARAGGQDAWRPRDRVPFGFGDDVLGVRDDLAFRRALALFRASQARSGRSASERLQLLGSAENLLLDLEQAERDRARRSALANLLGGVYFESSQASPLGAGELLDSSVAAYRRAVRLDPENADAKFNLELLLFLRTSEPGRLNAPFVGRGRDQVGGGQAGRSPPGEGY